MARIMLPRDILDRVDRILDYHKLSKKNLEADLAPPAPAAPGPQPSSYRLFPAQPQIALPTTLLDMPVSALAVLERGLDALPESQLMPPQDLKTLATWLHLSAGLTQKRQVGTRTFWLRSCPSGGGVYPCEVYVAALAIQGLEPGLYHYSPREFALRQLRAGGETLRLIKRGRPDLQFLKNVPAVLLISTIFCRAAWKYGRRGYRCALLDAGHLIQNLAVAGTGLGMRTIVRLMVHDQNLRELIGVAPDAEFGEAEAVHGLVIWADQAEQPLLPQDTEDAAGAEGRVGALAPLARPALASQITSYGSILAVHADCVDPGMAVRELRPPLTELSPLPGHMNGSAMPLPDELSGGLSLRQALLTRRSALGFVNRPISRNQFAALNHVAFCGGTYYPLCPDGAHVALVRPFWIVLDVSGVEAGVWYFHPPNRHWFCLRCASFRVECQRLCTRQASCGSASAVCFIMASLPALLRQGGPDVYRLSHLEAGIAGQRIYLAATAMGLSCSAIGSFYDDEVRQFLGLGATGWEPIHVLAIGAGVSAETSGTADSDQPLGWRD